MNSQNALTKWALAQQNNWNGLKESDEAGEEILRGYNNRMGVKYNPTDAWSAITISNAVMTNMGAEDKNSARKLGFNPTKSHSGYVKDAFRTNANPEYRYNRYVAQKPGESNYSIGDILVKGRSDTKGWKYEDFAKAGSGYKSHGDIIVDKGEDANGQYVVLGGGNVSDTYKNEKVYLNKIDKKGYKVKLSDTQSGVQLPQEEEVVEEVVETIAPKVTPNWWDYPEEEEVVAQQPIQQEVYSDELPYGVLSQLNAENQTALFGEQMFDEGGIVKPKGDPWEYKKDGDKYLTRKRGNKSWITATGLPEESIKSMVFKEIPVSDRVKEATANYTREKKSQPKSEAPRRKEAWRYVEPSESNKSKKNPYVDYWEGNISKKEYEIQKDEPNGWLRKKFNIPEDYKPSKNLFDESVSMDEFNREVKYERFKDFKNKGYSDVDIKIIMAQEESGEYVWNPDLETETGFGGYESQKMRDLKWKDDPRNFKNMKEECPPGQIYVNGKCTGQQSAGNSDSFFKLMPFFVGSVAGLAGYTAFEAMATPYAHELLSPVLDPVLGAAYDGAAAIYDGGAGAKKWVGDKTGWYKNGGPHDPPEVKQRKGSRKNYDYKEWTPSGLQFPTSVSSHLMKAEYVDDKDESTGKPVGWVGFPSLFQDSKPYANDQDNWVQRSEDNGWGPIYEEAKRRGEVYNFGKDKEAAIAFGEGSWKDQLLDEGIELTDEEVEEYRAGGYIVEEIE